MSAGCGEWQVKLKRVEERSAWLFETGQWSDCNFIVGQEPYQEVLNGHKLVLAMSSPVFEAMFYGSMPEKSDPIPIVDVQPKAFKALLQYIYTNSVNLSSFDLACELCYCAKKYMFPYLVQHCTRYIWSDLCSKNVCRAYEFSHLFEEFILRDQCLKLIQKQTNEILSDSSFSDIELETLIAILDQNTLNISSELDLFEALEVWAKTKCIKKQLDPNDNKCLRSVLGDALYKIRFLTLTPKEFAEGPAQSSLLTQEESFAILMNISSSANTVRMPKDFETSKVSRNVSFIESSSSTDRVSNPDRSNIKVLSSSQIVSSKDYVMTYKMIEERRAANDPFSKEDYLVSPQWGAPKEPKICRRNVYVETDILNYDILDSSLAFAVNKNICIVGIVVPTQLRKSVPNSNFSNGMASEDMYTDVVYAYLLDACGSRLTYTYFTSKVRTGAMMEIRFNRAIYIQRHKYYQVEVVFNKAGRYPLATCAEKEHSDSAAFFFNVRPQDNVRDGLIRAIVYT